MERSELEEIMRLAVLFMCVSVSVCLFICLCTRIGRDMHYNERLLVILVLVMVYSILCCCNNCIIDQLINHN